MTLDEIHFSKNTAVSWYWPRSPFIPGRPSLPSGPGKPFSPFSPIKILSHLVKINLLRWHPISNHLYKRTQNNNNIYQIKYISCQNLVKRGVSFILSDWTVLLHFKDVNSNELFLTFKHFHVNNLYNTWP